MQIERRTRYVPGVGLIAYEAWAHWAPGVEPRPLLTDTRVDAMTEVLIDRMAADAVDRLLEDVLRD